jgi:regulator of protease activity HflC (stomatin/prohibitin superfamily)
LFTQKVTVYEWERGLLYRRGRLDRVLEPGRYRLSQRTAWVRKLDVRETTETVPGQEVMTADGVSVRASLAATYAVTDPALAVSASDDYRRALYLALQLALRDVVASLPIDELVEQRSQLGGRLLEPNTDRARELGLDLRQVELKDLMLAGELRQMMAQVVAARKEGLASLERARGETAALRNLANAARLMEQNPMLLQLRLLQQLGGKSGNTVVLGLPASATPLPLARREDDEPSPLEPGQPDGR